MGCNRQNITDWMAMAGAVSALVTLVTVVRIVTVVSYVQKTKIQKM